ncbi:MAG TPA: Ig-like domain-containing protein [Chitinophagaceae bacterium]|nr:Ig-like domain-containing protein [Chitinophagaceae bacterium]
MKKTLLFTTLMAAGAAVFAQCPDLSTARKPMASSFHSSVIIDYNKVVRCWGDGASPTSAGTHLYSPVTVSGYTGTPLSVAAGSVDADASHQLYLHTSDTLYGWGYSNRTINATTAGNVTLTRIPLPGGVRTSDVSFIEASTGGLAIITNSGEVYVRKGNTTSGTGRIYGDGSTALDATTIWHQVLTGPGVPLTGVTRLSFSARALMALTSSNTVYVWGDATYLGDGSGVTNREYATLMTMPSGITPTDVNINSRTGENAAQFILGSDQRMYGVGNNASAVMGQGSAGSATYASWVAVKGPDGIGTLDDIVLIGSNNPYQYTTNAFAVGALTSSGKLYLWGNNNYDMIGGDTLVSPSKDSTTYTLPRIPPNFTYSHAAIGYFEMGGHTTAAFQAGSSKFCYIGHKIRGSMGDASTSSSTRKSFDCINTPEEFVCPPAPAIGCPLPSANDIFASSNHATLVINGAPAVAFWGEAASSAEPGINLTSAKTLYEYNGRPIGVAASAISAASSAPGTQMWVQTDSGVWGWGYSANTIQALRLNSVPITSLALPSGVTAANTSFIRSSRGGIALVTTTGNVWIKAGPGSVCSPRVYGDSTTTVLDTAWHRVLTSSGSILNGVVELSFGGTAALAITSSGSAYVWGDNIFLGDGTAATTRRRAALMTLHSDFSASMKPRSAEIIQSGALPAVQYIVGANNKIYCIGSNANGALGNSTPIATTVNPSWGLVSLTGVRKMSSNNPFADGFYSAGAILLTGNVYLWGANTKGMLGAGTASNLITPTVASTIPANDASNFEMGGYETIIFSKTNSRFYFAGRNRGGSKADGTLDDTSAVFTLAGTVSNCGAGAYNIGGKLLNDNNGMTDNLVNGTAMSTIRTTPMYVDLLDEGGYVIETKAIVGDTFTFVGYPFGNYYVKVTTQADTLFKLAPATVLPANWVFTGEQIGITASVGVDTGTADGKILVSLNGNKTNVNFGAQQLPAPVSATLNTRVNPGGTNTSPITSAFTGIDTLGTISKIHITGFPSNATSITIGATTYTSGTWPAGGVTYTVAGTVVALDPVDGAVTSVIPFRVIDNANFESPGSANATIPFTLIPPVANNIMAPALNSSDTARMIPQLKASNPSGTAITSYEILTVPPLSEGKLYYCASAPAVCALGSLTQITAAVTLTPAQSASLYFDPAQLFTGNSSFTYRATDANALVSNEANYRIPVFNNPPVTQNIKTAQVLDTHSKVKIPGLLGADVDGSVVSYTVLNLPAASTGTLSYCSNGTDTCTGVRITISTAGSTTLTPAQMGTLKFHPVPGATGDYVFSYTATDNNSLVSNTSTYTIPVVTLIAGNFPPVATNITSQNINNSLGQTPIPNLLGTDPDGLIDHYTIGGTLPPASQGVLYYCVTPGAGCATSAVTTGMTLSPDQAATLKFDPAPGFIGTASFTYTATDNNGTPLTSAPATYRIPVVNNPPVANPTSVAPILNTVTTPTLLSPLTGNDADGTVDSFNIVTVPAASSGILQYCIMPGAGCALTTIGTSGVSNLTPAQAATIRFTPNSGFTGDYVFTFTTVDNNHQQSQPATYTVPVTGTNAMRVGQPPVANSYSNAPISSTATAALTSALSGSDADGSVVNYTITSIPAPSHGTLTYCTAAPSGCGTAVAVGTILTPAQVSSLLFTPDTSFMGIATFNYTNKDNDSNISNTATVTIPVVNNPPYASNINNPGINRTSAAVTLNPLSSVDADGRVVSYTILTVPTADQGVLRLCTAPPSGGCTVVQPGTVLTGTEISRLSFTPDTLVHSPVVSFLYATTDNSGNKSNVAAVNIPIINAFELPIELLSFNAFKQGNDAFLKWETAIEKEAIVYQLMNSSDGQNWTIVDRQNAKGQGGITNNYSYLHTNRSGVQYYKLKISSVDNYTYSQVRKLTFGNAMSYSISLQPNPVTDKLYISTSDGSVMSEVELYNSEGKKVMHFSQLASGTAVDMSGLNTGLYMIRILDQNGETQTVKVTKK